MALDGVAIANIAWEIRQQALGGRIDKVYQPERDEIVLSMRSLGNNLKLLLTASSSHPRIHFTSSNKTNPMQAPLFCMVLRKHLSGGRLVDILQPNFERILELHIESLNEMGDMSVKKLIIEIMGKHSNIILTDENDVILDSSKHVGHELSSVRQVLPGLKYMLPPSKDKQNPVLLEPESFTALLRSGSSRKLQEIIYQSYNGISPVMASEICFRAGLDPDLYCADLTGEDISALFEAFDALRMDITANRFSPEVIFDGKSKPVEFSALQMQMFSGSAKKSYASVSELLEFFYGERDSIYRKSQKTADLKKIVSQSFERCAKKKDAHIKTLRDIKNRDTLKIWGELLTANIYALEKGMTSFTTQNFYADDMAEITIPLEADLTPVENAQKYFKRYNKEKRTFAALIEQMRQNDEEMEYLDGVLTSISVCTDENDIEEIRDELAAQGIIKKRRVDKKSQKTQKKSKPLHYKSSDGFDIYVGKNNWQNDELTLRFAENGDLWLHTKDIPGSHVIVRAEGRPLPDTTINEAANLAAFYSKAKGSSHVPVDYTNRKNVKKPNGAKPGMVIYENYKTASITPDEALVNSLMLM